MDAIGIEIKEEHWTIAHLKAGPLRLELKGWRVIPDKDKRVEEVGSYIREKGLKRPHLAICLPKGSYMAGVLKIPAPDYDSIGGILKFELDRVIPFNPEDAYYGFEALNRDGNLFTVLFTAVMKKTADELIGRFSGLGAPVLLTTKQAGLYNALFHFKAVPKELKAAFVCLEDKGFTIDAFDRGLPFYSRACDYSTNDELTKALKRELRLAVKRGHSMDEALIIEGKGFDIGSLDPVTDELGIPVNILKLKGAEAPASVMPAFGAALAALNRGRINLNLSPSAPESSYRETVRGPRLSAALGAFIALICVLYLLTDWFALKRLDTAISALEAKKTEIEGLKKESEALDGRIKALRGMKGDGLPGALEALKEVTELSPQGTWLTGFEYNGGSLIMEGFSERASFVFLKMGQSGLLRDIELSGPVTKGVEGKERFRIRMMLDGHNAGRVGLKG